LQDGKSPWEIAGWEVNMGTWRASKTYLLSQTTTPTAIVLGIVVASYQLFRALLVVSFNQATLSLWLQFPLFQNLELDFFNNFKKFPLNKRIITNEQEKQEHRRAVPEEDTNRTCPPASRHSMNPISSNPV
jgi:hypothetical protein